MFNNPVNNTDPSGFEANGEDSTLGFMGWGAATVGGAYLSTASFAGIAGGTGIVGLNVGTSLLTNEYGLFDGSSGSVSHGVAPTTAPKGTGANRAAGGGATRESSRGIGAAKKPPGACEAGMCLAQAVPGAEGGPGTATRSDGTGGGKSKAAPGTAPAVVPMIPLAPSVMDEALAILGRALQAAEELFVVAESAPAAAMASPVLVPGDSVIVRATPTRPFPGWDGTKPPGPGYQWRGKGAPGTPKGNWVNPNEPGYLHPDLEHGPPIGPHWDWQAPDGKDYRIFPDGRVVPKE